MSTLVIGSAAQAAPVVIDDFTTPGAPVAYVITLMSPDPHLVKSGGPGILGGERDLLVDVAGVPPVGYTVAGLKVALGRPEALRVTGPANSSTLVTVTW